MAANQTDPSQAARKVELIVAQLDSLPTLPRVATQLLRMTRSDQASTREVIALIKQDQALTARILSLARRANSGIRGEAATIDKCVLLMGLEAIRSAAFSIKIFEVFDPANEAKSGPFDLAGFWKHSLAVALACEQLGLRLAKERIHLGGHPVPPADELFVAGLLHDIGKAALHHCLPKSYAKVIEAAEDTHAPLLAIERRLIGIEHTVVGKRLGQRWNLPQGVIDAIWLHHNPPGGLPESVRQRGFAPIVILADLIAREQRLGYSGNYPRQGEAVGLAADLGIRREDIEEIARTLPQELAGRASLIGIDQLDSHELYYQALAGANQELAQLNARYLARSASLAGKAKYFDLLGEFNRKLQPGARPMDVAALIGQVFASVVGAGRIVVFSEPPDASLPPETDPPIEGVVCGPAAVESSGTGVTAAGVMGGPPRPRQTSQPPEGENAKFLLSPAVDEVDGLAAARRQGGFDPSQSAEGFGLHPLEGRLSWVHHRLANPLPLAGCYLLPLVAEGAWVGGVIFAAGPRPDGAVIEGWPTCRPELFALASAAGQALRMAQLSASADQLAEELARSAEHCAQLQEDLIRQRTLASVGQMAAGAGHELNNPLMVISGRSELLATEESDPKRREVLEQIRQNAQRASGIISELMDFARPPQARPERINLEEFVRRMTAPLAQSGVAVTVQADPNLPAASADSVQLQEAVQEILDNAHQAMAAQDSNRRLRVRITQPPLPPEALTPGAPRELELIITDSGVGMEAFVLEHATDPFFSARPAGRGRGLGLARARRLLEHNGGLLRLESQPGVGTTVRLYVPAAGD